MQIHGMNKTTLLDYPEHVAATLFTGGCNFRCPFCQNSGLVLSPQSEPTIPEDELFDFLRKRHGILSGVCITGGEPTLQPDLPDFLRRIRDLGYLIKLDTNGYRPDVLIALTEEGLIDYVAMDIKASLPHYETAAGIPKLDTVPIEESVAFLMKGSLPFEFRTTVVKGLHTAEDFEAIGPWLAGCPKYYLQSYKDSDAVLCPGYSSFSTEELNAFLQILKPYIPSASLRGVD